MTTPEETANALATLALETVQAETPDEVDAIGQQIIKMVASIPTFDECQNVIVVLVAQLSGAFYALTQLIPKEAVENALRRAALERAREDGSNGEGKL